MADVSEVQQTLVGLIGSAVYPNGIGQPPVQGSCIRIFPGWPTQVQLDADIAAGVGEISVWPLAAERNTTRYLEQWQTLAIQTPTLTLAASGLTVTVAGTIPPVTNPHNAVIFVNGLPYVYAVQPTDTLTSIATALATLILSQVPGTSSAGAVITVPVAARLGAARIGVTGTSVREIARQEKQFQISIWASSPQQRTALAKPVDLALKKLTFICLPDLTAGRIRYVGEREFDNFQKQGIYRRDLIYTVEYPTIETRTDTQITQFVVTVDIAPNSVATPQTEITIYE